MKKIVPFIIIGIIMITLTSGCNNYNELNNVMIIDGIGIDKQNQEYIVSFNSYLKDDQYEIHTIKNQNITDIFNDIYLEVNKKIYLSHLNVLALSSNLENDDIKEIINTLNKRNDLRGSFNVVLVHEYDDDIFTNTSSKIVGILENNYREQGTIYNTTFNDLINDYLEMDITYIPIINGNDLKIMGMHSLFCEYRFYNTDESIFLNLLHNKSKTLSFNVDNDEVKIDMIANDYVINGDQISFNSNMNYTSKASKKDITDYLYDNINNLLTLDISHDYFYNLIKKYDYEFYCNNPNFTITFDINITLNKNEINNMKEGDLLEKD